MTFDTTTTGSTIRGTQDGLARGLGGGSSFSRTIIEVNGNPNGVQQVQFISGIAIDWENGEIYMASGVNAPLGSEWRRLKVA